MFDFLVMTVALVILLAGAWGRTLASGVDSQKHDQNVSVSPT